MLYSERKLGQKTLFSICCLCDLTEIRTLYTPICGFVHKHVLQQDVFRYVFTCFEMACIGNRSSGGKCKTINHILYSQKTATLSQCPNAYYKTYYKSMSHYDTTFKLGVI